MTIDLHRDPSLRESAAYAIFGSRTAKLRLPSSSDRSRYTATRNLPSDNPVRAMKLMEETLSPSRSRDPRQPLHLFRRTSKPSLVYTVYWEADYDKHTELRLIDQSLAAIKAQHLQTLIVGRFDYPRRTHVLVNVINPSTNRVGIILDPYYRLMLWHLFTENDPYVTNSLSPRKLTVTASSLRKQDHRLLKLPPLFKESLYGVPDCLVDSHALKMLWQTGPSTFPTSDFIDTVHVKIYEIKIYDREERNDFAPGHQAAVHNLHHKRITRRKVLLGEHLLSLAESNPSLNEYVHESMDASLTDPTDRSLFGLPSLDSKLIVGFRPKKRQHEWCAAYTGDPTTLPDDLIGYSIEIQPAYPNPPWIVPIQSVIERTNEKLIVRTPPRDNFYPYFLKPPRTDFPLTSVCARCCFIPRTLLANRIGGPLAPP